MSSGRTTRNGSCCYASKGTFNGKQGTTLVVCGDTPLIKAETMEALIEHHEETEAKATVLTANADDPTGYGRIIRNEHGYVEKIVEHKDATEEERLIKEINTGTYCFDNEALFEALNKYPMIMHKENIIYQMLLKF